MEVDLLVHEEARGEEHLEGRQARLVEGQAALRDEGVAAQALGVHVAGGDAGEVGVAAHVVQVVDREDAGKERLEPAHPARHRRVAEGRLGDEEGDPGRVDRFSGGERVAARDSVAGRAAEAPDEWPPARAR